MNNAAFEPLWGNNRSGGDTFSTNRHRNGGDLWGASQIKKPLGGFKKVSANVFKSIYNFTLNLKSVISHYLKLNEAFRGKDVEAIEKMISKDSITTIEEPKVQIALEKVNDWSYFYNNGHIDQSGSLIRKDTMVYLKDVEQVQLKNSLKNNQKISAAYEQFILK